MEYAYFILHDRSYPPKQPKQSMCITLLLEKNTPVICSSNGAISRNIEECSHVLWLGHTLLPLVECTGHLTIYINTSISWLSPCWGNKQQNYFSVRSQKTVTVLWKQESEEVWTRMQKKVIPVLSVSVAAQIELGNMSTGKKKTEEVWFFSFMYKTIYWF